MWGSGLDWGWIGVLLLVFSCRELLFYCAVARVTSVGVQGRNRLSWHGEESLGTVLGLSALPMRRDHSTQSERGCQGKGDLESDRAAALRAKPDLC